MKIKLNILITFLLFGLNCNLIAAVGNPPPPPTPPPGDVPIDGFVVIAIIVAIFISFSYYKLKLVNKNSTVV